MTPQTFALPIMLAIPLFVGLLAVLAMINLAGDRAHAANKRRAKCDGYAHNRLYKAVSAWDGFTGWWMWFCFFVALAKVLAVLGGLAQ